MVKGYKALDEDMNAILGNGMHYELGKWYEVDGKIKILCKKLILKVERLVTNNE